MRALKVASAVLGRPLAWALVGSALSAGCQYDIDKLFEHDASVAETDGGATDEPPEHLIDLWQGDRLSDSCKACARSRCAADNNNCRNDESCLALTKCMASAEDPAALNTCRAEETEWLRGDIRARDVGGPYHTCVFLNECASQCESQRDLSCVDSGYEWPKASADSVWLHLQLLEGLESNPAPGVRVRACKSLNAAECDPASSGWATTDDKGVVDLEVTLQLGTFVGYLELEGGGLYPTLMRFGWPIARDMTTKVTVVSDGNARFLLNSVVPPTPTPPAITMARGFLQARAFACNGIPGVDVTFSTDAADQYTQDWYTSGQDIFPSFVLEGTTELGAGGITAVLPGRRQVFARHGEDEIASFSAPVRPGYMTIVFMFPGVRM